MNPHDHEKLERAIHDTLRGLPARRAPGSLANRVQAEIARRAALPWWRKSYRHWPSAARLLFVAVSSAMGLGVLGLTMVATAGIDLAPLKATFAPEIRGLQALAALSSSAIELTVSLLRSIPPFWLYGAIATVTALYLALFGLGAAAYRTLYVPDHSTR